MLRKDCGRRDNSGSVESYPYILELRDHTLPLPSHHIHNIYAGTALGSWIVFIILESCPVRLSAHEKLFRTPIRRPGWEAMAYASKTSPMTRIGVVPGHCSENAEDGSSHFQKRLLCYFESTWAQQYGTQAMWLERQLQASSGAFGDTTAISESLNHVDQQQYWEFKDADAQGTCIR